MALEWFRQHQKKFLAFLTAFLVVTWGFGSYLEYIFAPRRTVGKLFGTKVAEEDFVRFTSRWKAAFIGHQRETPELRNFLWKQFALVREAERCGLQVAQSEVDTFVRMMLGIQGQFTQAAYEGFLRTRGLSKNDYEEAVRERLLAMKLNGLIREQVTLSNTEIWQRYARDNEKVKIRYIAIKPEHFIHTISVTEDQVKKFYEEHKNDVADPLNGVYGYKLKEAVQAEVLLARYADLEKLAKISDKEISEYYEDHKESFKIEPKKEAAKEPDKKEQSKSPPSQNKKDEKSAGTKSAESTKPIESANTPQYKPLAEVKEEIRKKLAAREAQRLARALIEKADEAIISQLDQSERADFSKVAKTLASEGLTYIKTPLFTKDEDDVVPGILDFAAQAFERTAWEPSRKLESPIGPYIFQVIARRVPQVQPLNAVYDQVVKDLKADLAMKKAVDLAQRCLKTANVSGLEAALAEAQKEIPKPPQSKATPPKDKKASPAQQKLDEGLKIQESDYFTRPTSFGDGELHQLSTGIGGDRPNVAHEAFQLVGKALGLAIEEKGQKACYLIQVIDRKPADQAEFKKNIDHYRQRYLAQEQAAVQQAWLEELLKHIHLDTKTHSEHEG